MKLKTPIFDIAQEVDWTIEDLISFAQTTTITLPRILKADTIIKEAQAKHRSRNAGVGMLY